MFLKSLARKTIGDVPIAYAIGGKTGALGSWGKLFFVFWDNFRGKWTIFGGKGQLSVKSLARKTIGDVQIAYAIGGKTRAL